MIVLGTLVRSQSGKPAGWLGNSLCLVRDEDGAWVVQLCFHPITSIPIEEVAEIAKDAPTYDECKAARAGLNYGFGGRE